MIHDQPWTEDALAFRDPTSYGYQSGIVEGTKHAIIRPEVGEVCFFNTRNMHQVFPITKNEWDGRPNVTGSRIALSSFIGLLPAENDEYKPKLIFWS